MEPYLNDQKIRLDAITLSIKSFRVGAQTKTIFKRASEIEEYIRTGKSPE